MGDELNSHTDDVRSVAFPSDGIRIVLCSDDRSLRMWDLAYDGLHFTSSTPQHWIESLPHHDRLMWAPSEICDVLCYPPNVTISCTGGSATVDFVHSKLATTWAECYTPQ